MIVVVHGRGSASAGVGETHKYCANSENPVLTMLRDRRDQLANVNTICTNGKRLHSAWLAASRE